MRRKLFHFRTIIILIFFLSALPAKADKEASLFQIDLTDSITIDESNYLPVLVFDSLHAFDLVPFSLPYRIAYQKEEPSLPKLALEKRFDSMMVQNKIENRSVHYITITRPDLIEFYNLHQFDKTLNYVQEEEKRLQVEGVDEPQLLPMPFILEQPKKTRENEPWKLSGNLSVQFSQYYVTDNWHKGGTPNATFISILDYRANYEKGRWRWENELDVKIGFYNTIEDTLRAIRINNDLFRIKSRIGYKTSFSPKVYYDVTIDFNTSFFKGYKKTNSDDVVTSFLSPTRCFFGAGLDYRRNKSTRVTFSPLSYKVIAITHHSEIDPLSVGIDSFHYHKGYPGYLIQATLDWKFSKEIIITSDFDLFSSYDCRNIEFNWETVGRFAINRFLSTRLSLIMRFDNTPKNEDAKIQIQEQLSFGFSYHFQH